MKRKAEEMNSDWSTDIERHCYKQTKVLDRNESHI
jgi:hypothetical protein